MKWDEAIVNTAFASSVLLVGIGLYQAVLPASRVDKLKLEREKRHEIRERTNDRIHSR